jgi:hypothetical protein
MNNNTISTGTAADTNITAGGNISLNVGFAGTFSAGGPNAYLSSSGNSMAIIANDYATLETGIGSGNPSNIARIISYDTADNTKYATVYTNGQGSTGAAEVYMTSTSLGGTTGTGYLEVESDGRIYVGPSSRNIKTDIISLPPTVYNTAKFMQLNPVQFKYIDNNLYNGRSRIGFIAEEFQALGLSDVLFYDQNDQPCNISYPNITSFIVKIVQEQQTTIEALQTALTALESRVAALEV